ncbi:hypothetical protein DPMN_165447 [Dreissena polymorpha]|uniref:Uncharacterized protein n=1 Tax=Dreissena polymorpha TaxID=45954 RepID=A0A9D4IUL4_DREPO|nr:hypothetical protein DPMN_165447 [Dreissena polymorpha]
MSESPTQSPLPQGAQDFNYDFWDQLSSQPEPEAKHSEAEFDASQDLFEVLENKGYLFVLFWCLIKIYFIHDPVT